MIELVGRKLGAIAQRLELVPPVASRQTDAMLAQALGECGYSGTPHQFRQRLGNADSPEIEARTHELIEERLVGNRKSVPAELQDDIECIGYVMSVFAVIGNMFIFGRNNNIGTVIAAHAVSKIPIVGRDTSREDSLIRMTDVSIKMNKAGLIHAISARRGHVVYLTAKADALLAEKL
jgi:hypothetical protein